MNSFWLLNSRQSFTRGRQLQPAPTETGSGALCAALLLLRPAESAAASAAEFAAAPAAELAAALTSKLKQLKELGSLAANSQKAL